MIGHRDTAGLRIRLFFRRYREPVTIVFSAVIALAGAGIGANAALAGVDKQIVAQNVVRSQDKRDVAYKSYLEAANRYFYAWKSLAESNGSAQVEAASKFRTARFEVRTKLNEVWVHGSSDAVQGLISLGQTLPDAMPETDLPSPDLKPDEDKFRKAYNAFLTLRCTEVAPINREACVPRK